MAWRASTCICVWGWPGGFLFLLYSQGLHCVFSLFVWRAKLSIRHSESWNKFPNTFGAGAVASSSRNQHVKLKIGVLTIFSVLLVHGSRSWYSLEPPSFCLKKIYKTPWSPHPALSTRFSMGTGGDVGDRGTRNHREMQLSQFNTCSLNTKLKTKRIPGKVKCMLLRVRSPKCISPHLGPLGFGFPWAWYKSGPFFYEELFSVFLIYK